MLTTVHVFLCESEEAGVLYRDKDIWRTLTRHGRVLGRPTDRFLCELEKLGMFGLSKLDYRLDDNVSISCFRGSIYTHIYTAVLTDQVT